MRKPFFRKKERGRIMPGLLAVLFSVSLLLIPPTEVKAAGFLDYVQDIALGQSMGGSFTQDDYWYNYYYWDVYKFTIPQDGILNAYMETAPYNAFYEYKKNSYSLAIYSGDNPDKMITSRNINCSFSNARAVYYDTESLFLDAGSYYFVLKCNYDISAVALPYNLTLSFTQPVSSISLNKSQLKLKNGSSATLTASVLPATATDKTVTWTSSDATIASVNNGVVTAHAVGEAVITAQTSNGISASCMVTVTKSTAELIAEQVSVAKNTQTNITQINANKKKATIRYQRINGSSTGYQIAYHLKGQKWSVKNTTGTKFTIKKLKRKKTYSVRVRSYKIINGKTYYGKWSKIMKIKTK